MRRRFHETKIGQHCCVPCKRTHHCCATLRWSQNNRNVGTCWAKSLTGFKLYATSANKCQHCCGSMQTDATSHNIVGLNNVGCCWPTMHGPWAERAHSFLPIHLGITFSPLLDISERNFFPWWGGGGGVHEHPVHPPPPCVRAWTISLLNCRVFSEDFIPKWTENIIIIPDWLQNNLTTFLKSKQIRYNGAKIWNSIADDHKHFSAHLFKKKIKADLLNSY